MKIAIVDNQKESLTSIKKRFKKLNLHFIDIFTFFNVVEMEQSNILFDLILINIDMSEINGIEYTRNNRDKKVVFICSHSEFIKKTFGPNIYGYIEKEESDTEFKETITRALNEVSNEKFIILKLENGIQKFIIKDIAYFQYMGNRSIGFVYRSKSYISKGIGLKSLEKLLEEQFIYIDRSTLINIGHIIGIINGKLLLKSIVTEFKISTPRVKNIRNLIDKNDIKLL